MCKSIFGISVHFLKGWMRRDYTATLRSASSLNQVFIPLTHLVEGWNCQAIQSRCSTQNATTQRQGNTGSLLGSVQFYAKLLPPSLFMTTWPLHKLTRKRWQWSWGREEQEAFEKLKEWLCKDNVLVHYDPSLRLGISCDASEVGFGAVLFTAIPMEASDQLPIFK